MTWVVIGIFIIAILFWWASNLAGRLHQIHIRKDNLLISLRWQLIVRENLLSRLLEEGYFSDWDRQKVSDHVESANRASSGALDNYLAIESQVSGVLRDIFDEKINTSSTAIYSLLQELAQCCYRIELARRFHNDAVGAAILLHKKLLVRVLRLAGNTPTPVAIDMDDVLPEELQNILSGH